MADRLVVVDGYNLILRTPAFRPGKGRTLRQARDKLLNLLAWAVDPEVRFLVVFDGAEAPAGSSPEGRVAVRYSKPPEKADDVIRALVVESTDRLERITVVTSDLEVARHARALGAEVAFADLFLASLLGPAAAGDPEKPTSLSKKEIEEWAEIFRRVVRPEEDSGS
ncbi:MAG TPA: NYN domain-containing protein [Candidatus Eisenbacteria bacterium]